MFRPESGAGWSAGAKNSRQICIACWEMLVAMWSKVEELITEAALPGGSAFG
jgi:hypothetical protein